MQLLQLLGLLLLAAAVIAHATAVALHAPQGRRLAGCRGGRHGWWVFLGHQDHGCKLLYGGPQLLLTWQRTPVQRPHTQPKLLQQRRTELGACEKLRTGRRGQAPCPAGRRSMAQLVLLRMLHSLPVLLPLPVLGRRLRCRAAVRLLDLRSTCCGSGSGSTLTTLLAATRTAAPAVRLLLGSPVLQPAQ